MPRLLPSLLVLLVLAGPALAARREEPAPGEVDHLSIAALLVRDGNFDRAANELAAVDADADGVDLARYHTLRGLVALYTGDMAAAAQAFEAAIANGQQDLLVRVNLAQAYASGGRPEDALRQLEAAGDVGDGLPGTWHLRARCHSDLDQLDLAWAALATGARRFPDDRTFGRSLVFLLIQAGLFQEAGEQAEGWLAGLREAGRATPEDWVVIGEALRRAGQTDRAAAIVEDARLRFPQDVDTAKLLAGIYLSSDRPYAAGQVLLDTLPLDPSLAPEAAECFRKAGRLDRALYVNGLVTDPAEKVRQRLGLQLELGAWSQALSLAPRLERLGLSREEDLRYGLAYAAFRVADYDTSERWLRGIADARLFEDAVGLRQAIESCRSTPGGCE